MAEYTTFNDLQIGKKFKTASGIVYIKNSTKECKVLKDTNGKTLAVQKTTTAFYNTKLKVTPL